MFLALLGLNRFLVMVRSETSSGGGKSFGKWRESKKIKGVDYLF